MAKSSATLLQSRSPSLASVSTSTVTVSTYVLVKVPLLWTNRWNRVVKAAQPVDQSPPSVEKTEDATTNGFSSYTSVAAHTSTSAQTQTDLTSTVNYIDECVYAVPCVTLVAVQTDHVEASRRTLTNVAIQVDFGLVSNPLTRPTQTTDIATQTGSTPNSASVATQTDPAQHFGPIATSVFITPLAGAVQTTDDATPTAAPSGSVSAAPPGDPIRLSNPHVTNAVVAEHPVTRHDAAVQTTLVDNVADHTPGSVLTNTTTIAPSDDDMEAPEDEIHKAGTVVFLARLPLVHPRLIRLRISLPRVSPRATFGLHLTAVSSRLVLCIISVIIMSGMLNIVGRGLLSSKGAYDKWIGWMDLHDVHPGVEGFSENGWSIRNIVMDRWRRFWYGYWERRELARMAT